MRSCLVAGLVFLTLALPAWAQSEGEAKARIQSIHGDAEGFEAAFKAIHDTFSQHDPKLLADYASYPLDVEVEGVVRSVPDAAELTQNFDTLLTPPTQEALAGQDYADLIVTSEGVGFANGALWITNVCLDESCAETHWQIIRINN